MNFGDYRIRERLAESALEQTDLADHETLQLPVFLRRWNAARLAEFEPAGEYIHRVQTATAIHHPHLLAALDAGTLEDVPYTAAEYIPSADLASFVGRMGALPFALACEYIRQAAAALQAAHSAGFLHGWLSPASLLLTPVVTKTREDGTVSTRPAPGAAVKLRDVGQLPARPSMHGRPFDPDADLGPVEFLPPERIDGSAFDAAADVYGLGACLYYLLAGQPAFTGGSPIEILLQIQQREPAPLTAADLDPAVADLVARTMAKRPADRPALDDVLREIEPFCEFIAAPPTTEPLDEPDPFGGDLSAGESAPVKRAATPPAGGLKPMTWIMIGSACWLVAILAWVLMFVDFGGAKPDANAPPPVKQRNKGK